MLSPWRVLLLFCGGLWFSAPALAVILGGGNNNANNNASANATNNSTFTSNQNAQPAAPNVQLTPEQMQAVSQQFSKQNADQNPEQMTAVAKKIPPEQVAAIAKQFHHQMKMNGHTPAAAASSIEAVPATGTANAVAEHEAHVESGTTQAVLEHTSHLQTEQAQAQEKTPEQMKSELAFESLLNDVLPMSPEQIKRLHKYYDMTLEAKSATPHSPPTPQFSSIQVNLEPGSTAPVIRLSAGFVTSLLFVDSSGEPWNIHAYSIGDPQSFNIQWDQKSNAMFIQSMKQYSHGNLAVRLHQLDTPVMITLVSGQKQVDFRVDLQVPGRGPNAKAVVVETPITSNVNPILLNILDGIPPIDSIKLCVSGGPGDAWLYDQKIYFRTRLTVLSPAWVATVSSADGTHVYEMMQTPYIMGSEDGKTVNIKLSGL